jgi:hypothetical protein
MAEKYPPFMNAYGLIGKIFERIKQAKTPDRFTVDFLGTKLGYKSGSARPFIPFPKRIGLLGTDGTPTELYKSFRNPSQSKSAIAQAMKIGYADLYTRNEYAHALDGAGLEGLVVEVTGLDQASGTLRAICSSFEALKDYADFETILEPTQIKEKKHPHEKAEGPPKVPAEDRLRWGIGYTINLNLPKTDDKTRPHKALWYVCSNGGA